MKCTIFYSWQSDLPNKDNRSFIENCIEKSIKKIKVGFEVGLTVAIDRDAKKMVGTPDIAGTILIKLLKQMFLFVIYLLLMEMSRGASVQILMYC